MNVNRMSTPQDYQLLSRFQLIQKRLQQQQYSTLWERPLSYWVKPDDRRLPISLLGDKLGDLLSRSFDDLYSTPGVGRKKLDMLVSLLDRAALTDLTEPTDTPEKPVKLNGNGKHKEQEIFNPRAVSDEVWTRWRETVRRHGLGSQRLGRLAPSLLTLPSVIWNTPLRFYLDLSLDEIRKLKTHGEKRIQAVMEIFFTLHQMLHHVDENHPLALRLAPQPIADAEDWLTDVAAGDTQLDASRVREALVLPLLEQIRRDGGETLYRLIASRLGVDGKPQNVRTLSKRLGVTRARVYQMFEDCSKLIYVRWPLGECYMTHLAERVTDPPALELLTTVLETLYAV